VPVLSEADSKRLLARFGVPFADERVVGSASEAAAAAEALGFPVAVKLNGDTIAHKTERGLVRLGQTDAAAVATAASELLAAATPADGVVTILVAAMVRGTRELIAGLADDPQFGATVMLGVGGVLAEAIADVVFRLVPLSEIDALEMIDELASPRFLGPFRGEPAVDRDALVSIALALSRVAEADSNVRTVDLNPLIVADGRPVAVDALVELRA
jgi:succinyl-CoA synthetase beta subunit